MTVAIHERSARLRVAARCTAVVIGSLCLAHTAMANDTSEGVAPRMLSAPQDASPRSVIDRSAVRMEGGEVTVSLTAQATLPAPAQWLIQGPLFGWLGDSETYPDRHFPELRVLSAGQPAPVTESVRAVAGRGAVDVSTLLQQAGINPWLIADTPPFVATEGISADLLAQLVRAGAIGTSGADHLAQWRAQRTLGVALPPGQMLDIRYRLRPAYSLVTPQALAKANLRQRYCLADAQWQALSKQFGRTAQFIAKRYEIAVGAQDRTPPPVRLSVVPQPGVALVAACTRGSARPAGVGGWADIEVVPDQRAVLHVLTLEHAGR
ncbi:MAG: hypothetical protein EON50_21075 [Acidovorax sp.]|nr:MAG: hypothetical protein EON50_21075 [Acidovorax sp.]